MNLATAHRTRLHHQWLTWWKFCKGGLKISNGCCYHGHLAAITTRSGGVWRLDQLWYWRPRRPGIQRLTNFGVPISSRLQHHIYFLTPLEFFIYNRAVTWTAPVQRDKQHTTVSPLVRVHCYRLIRKAIAIPRHNPMIPIWFFAISGPGKMPRQWAPIFKKNACWR